MECKICNKKMNKTKELSNHLRFIHNIKPKNYYNKYILNNNDNICAYDKCFNNTTYDGLKTGYRKHCSTKCSTLNKETQSKMKKTSLKNHGVEYALQSKLILNKMIEDNKQKYKVEHISHLKSVREKTKKTNLERYGVENPLQSKEVKEKTKKTNLERYGVENVFQLKYIREKYKITCLEKYGVDNPSKVPEFLNKSLNKRKETQINNGSILPDNMISDFKIYQRKVSKFTNISKKRYTKEELKNIGKCGIDGAEQVDHKYSIKQGFLNNIPSYIIGHYENLEIINWEQNDKKKDKCSITLIELFLKIYKNKEILN